MAAGSLYAPVGRKGRVNLFIPVGPMSGIPPIVFQVLIGILVLVFIYLTYVNTRTWQWVQVTFLFLVFAASLGFLFLAALTLKTRSTWIGRHDKLEKQLAETEQQVERLTRGDPNQVGQKGDWIVSLREQLESTIIDRGRVWRGCQPTGATPDFVVTVNTSPPPAVLDPTAAAPPPAQKNNIQPKTILHAFREAPLAPPAPSPDGAPAEPGPTVPVAYIGDFEVIQATDQSVTMRPTMPLSQDQIRAGSGGAGVTWALYEVCPIDGHEWFANIAADETKAQEEIQKLFPRRALADLSDEQYRRLVEPYLRDGKPADPQRDPPENVWYEVKFIKPYTLQVDGPAVNSFEVEPFNAEGQAQTSRLRKAGSAPEPGVVEFGPQPPQTPTALLDKQTAEELIQQGICELNPDKQPPYVYRRKLTDYERQFHSISQRIVQLGIRMQELDLDNKALLASIEKAEAHTKALNELKSNLTEDLSKVKAEQEAFKKYADALHNRLAEVQSELSHLYRSNKALNRELADLNRQLTEEIEERSRSATASVR